METLGTYPAITTPFAAGDSDIQFPDVNFGLTAEDACPYSNGGTQISRHKMNGLGYLATLGAFLDRIGYPYGYTEGVSYPKGAIVSQYDEKNGRVVEYLNTKDNNTERPIDSVIITEIEERADLRLNGWTPVGRVASHSFFPDYGSKTRIGGLSVDAGHSGTATVVPPSGGWMLVTRTIDGWDGLDVRQRLGIGYETVDVQIGYTGYDHGFYSNLQYMLISQYEGGTASRFLPCPKEIPIKVTHVPNWIKSVTVDVYLFGMEQ